ncbi:hypothetical protein ACIHDR_37125 [Nocardia sp. NPDC052278]|uniref:hypothetical protein n=1 Tax=unclassified Nocardia TaxID=2637762 RepID=UPI0036C17027
MLRYYVHHQQCHKRIFGKTRQHYTYYTRQPQLDRVGNPESYADHPPGRCTCAKTRYWIAYKPFSTSACSVPTALCCYATDQLRDHDSSDRDDIEGRIAAIEKTVAEITRRQNNLLDERESRSFSSGDEIADAWAERLRHRFAELEHERRTKNTALEALREQAARRQPNEPDLMGGRRRPAPDAAAPPDCIPSSAAEPMPSCWTGGPPPTPTAGWSCSRCENCPRS